MIILAHRANLAGKHSVVENSLAACRDALEKGFGLETDIRRDASGAFYISHDPHPRTPENSLEDYSELFARFPNAQLAINVKELGYEPALIALMNSGKLGRGAFYFDFELLETKTPGAAQRKIRTLPGGATVRMASRMSDRNEPVSQCLSIPGEIVWGDEFDKLWITEEDVKKVHAAGRKLYMISPELHGFDLPTMKKRWQDFKDWGVDAVCTDWPVEAKIFFSR